MDEVNVSLNSIELEKTIPETNNEAPTPNVSNDDAAEKMNVQSKTDADEAQNKIESEDVVKADNVDDTERETIDFVQEEVISVETDETQSTNAPITHEIKGEAACPNYNRRALSKDAKTYELEKFSENVMIIFNHEKVIGYEDRLGTNEDVKAIQRTFSKFRFVFKIYHDQLRKEIADLMLEFAETDFTNYGCVAITILTHGSEKGGLRAKDKKYREAQILELIKQNPTLATKPILYIIQACRGDRLTSSVNIAFSKKDNVQRFDQYKLPLEADTLVLHSTYEGKFSYRSENSGSWFIQTLCEMIDLLADDQDIESIMTEVRKEVAINREEKIPKRLTDDYDYNKQMPVSTSTLIRKLYLKRSLEGHTVEALELSLPVLDLVCMDSTRPRRDESLPSPTSSSSFNFTTRYQEPPPEPLKQITSEPCGICVTNELDRFDYMYRCLNHYVKDELDDSIATMLLTICKTYTQSVEFNGPKAVMARTLRDHLQKKVSDAKYKYLHIWKDHNQ